MGDTAKITLVAFPKQTFEGKVLSIDPAEKIVDNVVYYEVTIDFPNQPNDVKSGMTADIVIETNKKDSVLRVPKNAIENVDGKNIVQVIVNKDKIENRQITTGLEGNDYYEVVSGLSEGDTIIVGKK
jgi:multidrug efflux pump subunit AcrA (membrane-fusion protein)